MKYRVKDNDREYEVEEIVSDDEVEEAVEPTNDDQSLTSDEIAALKAIAKAAPQLMELVKKSGTSDEDIEEEEEEEVEEVTDEDEEEEEEEEKIPKHDSKSSYGSIEKKSKKVDDSIVEDEIASAWAKRYGGTN